MNHNNFQKNQGLSSRVVAAFRTNPSNGFYLWVAMWPVLAIIGVVLLKLPMSSTGDVEISMIDAIFTSISAVTLTGLTVVDTNLVWSTAGLLILLGFSCFTCFPLSFFLIGSYGFLILFSKK